MPRSFQVTAQSEYAVARIHTAFRDRDYWWARISAFEGGEPTLDSCSTDTDGTTTVHMTLRFGVDQLPPPLHRLPRGTLRVLHAEAWRATGDGALQGRIDVDVPGRAMSGHGDLSVTPSAMGSQLAGTGTVDVRLPIIGGAVASFLASQLVSGIRDIHEFTERWIAEQGPPFDELGKG